MSPKVHAGLLLVAVVAVLHFTIIGWWVVDDGAIAWEFSRNWAEGRGLVPVPGAERVEGYSDFLWVAILAVAHRIGLDLWVASKLLGSAMTVLTVPLVYRLGAAAHPRRPVLTGFLAAGAFALDSQVAIFGASGLENALFELLLALGLVGAEREAREQSTPWSALAFLGLAVTRPEGIAYAAAAGLLALLRADRDRRGAARIATWLALFWIPFAAYHSVRWWYFAWPFPMTYYAKVRAPLGTMFNAATSGWGYFLGYFVELGRRWFLPVVLVGRLSTGRWRPLLLAAAAVGAGLAFLPFIGPVTFAVGWLVLGAALAVPGADERGEHGVTASAWVMALVSVLFCLYAQGDWMGAFRWMSFAAVPVAVLVGVGAAELAGWAESRQRYALPVVAALVALAWAGTNGRYTERFVRAPDIHPFLVRERVAKTTELWRRLHVDGRPRILTIDQGGFLWFSDYDMMDYVGLVDPTFGAHSAKRLHEVTEDWLGVRHPADFVSLSEEEARRTRRYPDIARQYVAWSPQESVRRGLLFAPSGSLPALVDLGPVVVHGLRAPGGPVAGVVYVELDVSSPTADAFSARVVLADESGAARASWPVPLGAAMVSPDHWDPGEIGTGRYHLALPEDLPAGRWQLGLRISLDGLPLRPADDSGIRTDDSGAMWLGVAFDVAAPDAVDAAADEAANQAIATATAGDCDAAERAGFLARRRTLDPRPFDARNGDALRTAIAACLTRTAGGDVDRLARALELDGASPGLAEAAAAVAAERQVACDAAAAAEDWSACVDACDAVMRLAPTRSWTRRTAERCRVPIYEAAAREHAAEAEREKAVVAARRAAWKAARAARADDPSPTPSPEPEEPEAP